MAHSAHTHDKSSTSEELVVRVNHEDRFAQVYRAPLAGEVAHRVGQTKKYWNIAQGNSYFVHLVILVFGVELSVFSLRICSATFWPSMYTTE